MVPTCLAAAPIWKTLLRSLKRGSGSGFRRYRQFSHNFGSELREEPECFRFLLGLRVGLGELQLALVSLSVERFQKFEPLVTLLFDFLHAPPEVSIFRD